MCRRSSECKQAAAKVAHVVPSSIVERGSFIDSTHSAKQTEVTVGPSDCTVGLCLVGAAVLHFLRSFLRFRHTVANPRADPSDTYITSIARAELATQTSRRSTCTANDESLELLLGSGPCRRCRCCRCLCWQWPASSGSSCSQSRRPSRR